MSLTGWATPEGTGRYINRFAGKAAPGHFRHQHGLSLSSIGIGTYLGEADKQTDALYVDAVTRTVQLGGNVIDSAANYRFQRSEKSIGEALLELTQNKGFSRDEIILCTKGGYLPFDGAPPRDIRSYVEDAFVRPGIARFEEIVGGSHCMTPAYLANQLSQSLRNMFVDSIDVYYVHNPESQLGYITADVFYQRLELAFEYLEKARSEGKIRMYGVATWNGFRTPSNSKQFHSLSKMVELAKTVGGELHGFRFVQLPFNLAMPEALTLENQSVAGETISTVEAANRLGVTVVASASILQGRVARGLPEKIRETFGSLKSDAQTAIQFVRSAPGVTTALIGMSHAEHVEENLELAQVEPVKPEEFVRVFDA